MKGRVTYEGEQEVDLVDDTYVVCFTVVADCSYQPERVSGPPEDCYPSESECDIVRCSIDLIVNSAGEPVNLDSVTEACSEALDMEAIEDKVWEQFHERE